MYMSVCVCIQIYAYYVTRKHIQTHTCTCTHTYTHTCTHTHKVTQYWANGVATISRLLKIIGLFCKRVLKKRLYSAKETYNFKEPTNHSHLIPRRSSGCVYVCVCVVCVCVSLCVCRVVGHDSFTCLTWLIHMCEMTHSYVWHDSFIHITTLSHMCDTTCSNIWHDSFTCIFFLLKKKKK